jgi:tetratricopeptide (TPR) repeat protein
MLPSLRTHPSLRNRRPRGRAGWAPHVLVCVVLLTTWPAVPAARQSAAASEKLAAAMAAYHADQYETAEALFTDATTLAFVGRDRRAEAEAQRGLGITLIERARFADADLALQRAFALFALEGDRVGIAKVFRHRSVVADVMGREADALLFARLALAEFEHLDEPVERARAAIRLASLVHAPAEHESAIATALAYATAAGDPALEAHVLHQRADRRFVEGRFAEAGEDLARARALYEAAGDQRDLARVLTSLGRLHRAHGAPELAVDDFARAFDIQTRVGDRQGAIQSLNATAIALGHLDRHDEALERYQQALEMARQTGSPRIVNFQTGNLGGAYLARGETALAIPLLEVSAFQETNRYTRAIRFGQLAEARYRQRAFAATLAAATKAIDLMRADRLDERLFGVLNRRALAHDAMGSRDAALEDAREALATIERVRAQLLPDDFLKRGFHNEHQELYATAIELLDRAAHHDEALEASEQARSRAFLDLLASRGVTLPAEVAPAGPAPAGGSAEKGDALVAASGATTSQPMVRGAAREPEPRLVGRLGAAEPAHGGGRSPHRPARAGGPPEVDGTQLLGGTGAHDHLGRDTWAPGAERPRRRDACTPVTPRPGALGGHRPVVAAAADQPHGGPAPHRRDRGRRRALHRAAPRVARAVRAARRPHRIGTATSRRQPPDHRAPRPTVPAVVRGPARPA